MCECDYCPTKKLNDVEVQENGIIRNSKGRLIGRLVDEIKFDSEHLNSDECEIKTNERFDELTNHDISTHYRDREYYFMRSDFLGAFSYWVVAQSPYDVPELTPALKAFEKMVSNKIKDGIPAKFTYESLKQFINEDIFEVIPEIEILNHPKISEGVGYQNRHNELPMNPDYDFIDLGALARNVFFMLLRESITQ